MNREDLIDYRYNQEWIKERLEYIEEYKTILTKTTSTLSDMPQGSRKVQDSMAEKIATLLDNINLLYDKMILEQEKQKKILAQLKEVEQPYRIILEKGYIQGKSLVTIASEMDYDYKYMCKMKGIALNKFDEKDNTTKEVETRH